MPPVVDLDLHHPQLLSCHPSLVAEAARRSARHRSDLKRWERRSNMNSIPWIIYLVLAGAAVVQALLLLLHTWEQHRYACVCMRTLQRHRPTGRALVLAPCKGADFDLPGNLRAVLAQDYDDYEVVFIVEEADDPACAVIRRLLAEPLGAPARLVVAGRASEGGQKVHNLRAATAQLPPEIRYLVFVDSDARPRPQWLRLAIARLYRPALGATTGYRWFIPGRPTLAHHLLYSINCTITSLLGRNNHYMVWGGSWAIGRDRFEALGMRQAWKGVLSDDLMASRVLRQAKQPVRFEPACVVASPLSMSLAETLAFLRRQYLIARHYVPGWWLLAVWSATFRQAVGLGTLIAIGAGLVDGRPAPWIPAAVGAALYLLGAARRAIVQNLAGVYFPQHRQTLRAARLFDIWAGPLAALLEWLVLLSTVFGRALVWRGIRYRLCPQQRIVPLSLGDGPSLSGPHHSGKTASASTTPLACPAGEGQGVRAVQPCEKS
jgi:hypothetical protein